MTRQQIRAAYLLVRLSDPSLSLARWVRYARRVAGHPSAARHGILVARWDGAAHPCGTVCYQRIHHLQHGWLLAAEHFAASSLLHSQLILSALAAGLERVALGLGCTAIRSVIPGGSPASLANLVMAGHVPDGTVLIKSLDGSDQLARMNRPSPA